MFDLGSMSELARMAGAGLVAGIFASIIAAKDHRHKKWWEMRVAAYQALIEALSDLVYVYDVRYQAAIEYRELSDSREAELAKIAVDSYGRVRKAADAGAFLFSAKANAALELVRKEWESDHEMYVDRLDGLQAAAKQCLKTVVALSKTDLELTSVFRPWK